MPDLTDAFREKIKRRAILMEIGGFRPPEDTMTSWFGKVGFGLPNEQWPMTEDQHPMLPLAQINLTAFPFRPKHLEDIAFLTVFIDPKQLGKWDNTKNGSTWCVRAYPSLDSLMALQMPSESDFKIQAFAMRPKIIEEDYPVYDDLPVEVPENLADTYIDDFDNVSGFKLGGWPTLIQSEIFWAPYNNHPAKPEFVFQIDSTEKGRWSWGDGGVGYFGRGTAQGHENDWVLAWQCM